MDYQDKNITKEYLRKFTVSYHAWRQFVSKTAEDKRREHWLDEIVYKQTPRYRVTLNCFGTLDLKGGKARQCSWDEYNVQGEFYKWDTL